MSRNRIPYSLKRDSHSLSIENGLADMLTAHSKDIDNHTQSSIANLAILKHLQKCFGKRVVDFVRRNGCDPETPLSCQLPKLRKGALREDA